MTRALLGLSLVWVLGCGDGVPPALPEVTTPPDDVPEVTPMTGRARLEASPVSFRLWPQQSSAVVVGRRMAEDARFDVAFAPDDGRLELQAGWVGAGATLAVSEASFHLGDATVAPEALPPNGLALTEVTLTVRPMGPLALRWYGDGSVGWAQGTADVTVKASLRLSNGHSSPLAPGVLTGVPVTVLLSPTSEGVMAAQLDLRHEGAMWQWLGLLEAGDLRASLYTLETSALDGLPPREVLR